jgi:hypothetical protein
MTKASYFTLQNQISDFHHRLLVLLCYKQSQAPSVTKRAGGELLDKMFSNLNS